MAMNYKPSMTKAELLEIATANGVQADDSMTKTAILAALDGANSRAPDGAELNTSPEETAADGQQAAQSGAGQAGDREGTEDTAGQETPAEDAQEAPEGYNLFVYAGPSLPRGRLKENGRVQRDVRGRESVPCGRDRGLSPCSADDRPC